MRTSLCVGFHRQHGKYLGVFRVYYLICQLTWIQFCFSFRQSVIRFLFCKATTEKINPQAKIEHQSFTLADSINNPTGIAWASHTNQHAKVHTIDVKEMSVNDCSVTGSLNLPDQ